jgi:hypothetical protein
VRNRFVLMSLLLCVATVARGDILIDPSFEQQAPNIPSTSAGDLAPDGGWTGAGYLSTSDNPDHGWKVTDAGEVYACIKERRFLQQRFNLSQATRVSLDWLDANRPSYRSSEWFGRPNDYRVVLEDADGGVMVLGNYTSEVGGGNAYSTPPGTMWWTEVGKEPGSTGRSGSSYCPQGPTRFASRA